ncbi:UIT6 family transporter [Brevibacterium sanguinis]|uniref:UIT6 family transporter n=2 Tax=Brevibacterium TaxID=1696 RepID=A0A366IF41_9MICO|nr:MULTISPECIES: sodium:proton antiporter [Brevibacterium]RBP61908.1 UIT6 family transporter [Brevibacterium sanguinis]RBP68646.1 UIT6 family transporter [Brevibacterium celere]
MTVDWWAVLPFALLLAGIAVLPLIPATARLWERNSVKLVLSLLLGVPIAMWFALAGEGAAVIHALIEYGQFIVLIGSLFVAAGGIFLVGDIRATPLNNTLFLAVGGVVASFIGTTGAAMLLIRPILNTNQDRRHRAHTVVYTIFIVANCGGLLTPLGDPPLFLGMLRGVPFEWTFGLWPQWLFVNGLLLVSYFALDARMYAQEPREALIKDAEYVTRLGLRGASGLVWLAVIVLAVAFVPSLDLHAIEEGHASAAAFVPWREIVMLLAAAAAFLFGDRGARFTLNRFTWTPILEVAALFIGIFLTMIPALEYLRQVAHRFPLDEVSLFVFTGSLSAVLDNAPTYVTFFEMAAQVPGEPRVAGVAEALLVSVSLGAVMGGAVTYIGNGPNFMVKSVAESADVDMPSFLGYVRWSLLHLVPVLAALVLLFIADGPLPTIGGVAVVAGIVVRAAWDLRSSRRGGRT